MSFLYWLSLLFQIQLVHGNENYYSFNAYTYLRRMVRHSLPCGFVIRDLLFKPDLIIQNSWKWYTDAILILFLYFKIEKNTSSPNHPPPKKNTSDATCIDSETKTDKGKFIHNKIVVAVVNMMIYFTLYIYITFSNLCNLSVIQATHKNNLSTYVLTDISIILTVQSCESPLKTQHNVLSTCMIYIVMHTLALKSMKF